MCEIEKDVMMIGKIKVVCDKPLARLGFLYFTIDGNDAGRIVFMKEPDENKKLPLVFHFNQTILALEYIERLRTFKLMLREAICEHFKAVDKSGDLNYGKGEY